MPRVTLEGPGDPMEGQNLYGWCPRWVWSCWEEVLMGGGSPWKVHVCMGSHGKVLVLGGSFRKVFTC